MNVFDFARMVEERRAELRLSLPRVTPSMWDNGGVNEDVPGTVGAARGLAKEGWFPRMDDFSPSVNPSRESGEQ